MRCFSSSPKKTHLMLLFFIAFFTLRFLSLVVIKVVFLVVSLPLILPSSLGFQDMVFGDLTSIARGRLHDDFVLSTLPFMFPYLVAAFIVACVSVTLSFAMFATPGLDNVLLRVCSVDLEDCFCSQVWAHVSRGWLSFSLTHVVLFFLCSP
ncbi:hypothetical protein F2Q68_00029051 [Brassica cretica]|uniref:Uncharacterized protein n=1 Tax=Brassica cretica TaxID=69181 RepID=A0A8S9GEU2_BRACR|nr:hypothetical protein F2Q68_00029051 [Brassica cretica]